MQSKKKKTNGSEFTILAADLLIEIAHARPVLLTFLKNNQRMHLILKDADFNHRQVECLNCQWNGPAAELVKGDYFLLSQITEVFCPNCHKYLGFIQHETPDDAR